MTITADEHATLELLLEQHPTLLTFDQIRERLPGVDVDQAVRVLLAAGLATRLGELVGASWTAARES